MATIYEVAELAGVSLATVSRVINGDQNVSAKTYDKVKDAMNSLQYRPSNVAQSLALIERKVLVCCCLKLMDHSSAN